MAESYNKVFRGYSIRSNRQSPSRDIALGFKHAADLRFVCDGGVWSNADGVSVTLGPQARRYAELPHVRVALDLTVDEEDSGGMFLSYVLTQ